MSAPAIGGLHHIKIPVGDLTRSVRWHQDVFDAVHRRELDHIGTDGRAFASIVAIPGLVPLVELRWAPIAARGQRQCDTLILAIDAVDALADWVAHLDARDVDHSPVLSGPGGSILVIVDPDGKYIRLVAPSPVGSPAQDLTEQRLDPQGPWLNPIPMQHPHLVDDHDA